MFSIRNAFPVASERLRDERKICPPPSPDDPSIRIISALRLLPFIPSRKRPDAVCKRSPPNRLELPSLPQSACTLREFHQSHLHPCGIQCPPSCVHDLRPRN